MKTILWNFKDLLKLQQDLDNTIFNKKNLNYPSTFTERQLSLIVELNEFINETKAFKYWSINHNKPSDKLIEEYVDCLHFCLSLLLHYDFKITEISTNNFDKITDSKELSKTLLNLNLNLKQITSKETFLEWFKSFLSLSTKLGISQKEIFHYYKNKSNINFERQLKNY